MYRFSISFLVRLLKIEVVWVSLVLIGFTTFFLAAPLLQFNHTYYSPTDILQSFPTFLVGNGPVAPHNYVISDDILTYLPWQEFAAKSLQQGQLPLWNPYNGGGRPLLANMQGSFFNPLVWLQFGLGLHLGLLLRAFVFVYLAGLFAFGYFKSVGMWVGAALCGAVAFMFGGMVIIWNHTELGATFILLPLGLMVLEKRLSGRIGNRMFWVWSSLVMVWEVAAGHPETIYLNSAAASIYLIFRLATLQKSWGGLRQRLVVAGLFAGSGLTGMVMGAAQLLPFVEYLSNSYALAARSQQAISRMAFSNIITFVLPDPFGNPTFGTKLDFARPNYSEISGGYVGAGVVFLALCSLWLVRRQPLKWLWLGLCGLGLAVVYGLGPVEKLVGVVSPVAVNYARLVGYVGFGLICLMVLSLQALYELSQVQVQVQVEGGQSKARASGRWAGWQIGLAGAAGLLGLWGLFEWFKVSGLVPFKDSRVAAFETREFQFSLIVFGLIVLGLVGLVRWPKWHRVVMPVLVVGLFLQAGWYSRNYRAPTDAAYFNPRNPTVNRLNTNGGRVAVSGNENWLPAEINVRYGIEQVNGYDSLEVAWYERLRKAAQQRKAAWEQPAALDVFNVQQVLVSSKNPNFQGERAKSAPQLRRQGKLSFLNVYMNQRHQPKYRMVYRSVERNDAQATRELLDGTIDPVSTLVLMRDMPAVGDRDSGEAGVGGIEKEPTVKVLQRDARKARLQVENPQPGYLYIDQTYFPGWQAKINGKAVPLERANVAFTALPVEAGPAVIDLEYDPMSFRLGLWISLLGWLVVLAAANLDRLRRWSGRWRGPVQSPVSAEDEVVPETPVA